MRTRRLQIAWIFAFVAGAAGCTPKAKVPKEYQGTARVRIQVDRSATHNLCDFWLTPIGAERARYGWLSSAALGVGKVLDFTVKPGRYKMSFFACQNWWSAAPVTVDATVRRGVEVLITPRVRLGVRTEGMTTVYAMTSNNPPPGESGGGEEVAEEPQEDSSAPAAPAGAACKPNGAESSLYSECCSNKTAVIDWHGSTKSVCCASGPRCH